MKTTKLLLLLLAILLIFVEACTQKQVPRNGLISYYPFNEDFNDKSGNNFNGKVTDVVLTGSKNKACLFNGRNALIEIPGIELLKSVKQLTISCWINPFAAKPWDSWICKANDTLNNSQWRLSFSSACESQVQFTTYNTDWTDYHADYKFEMGKWYHVVYLIDNMKHNASIMINGKIVKTFVIGEIKTSNGPLMMGFQKDDMTYYYGLLDEVLIYDRVLGENEIFALYEDFKDSEKAEPDINLFKPYKNISAINSKNKAKVTYLSCEGFMIESKKKKILVDALYEDSDIEWYDLISAETKTNLENGLAPFDNVNLIAVTHDHWDHFSQSKIIGFMTRNPKCQLVCPVKVNEHLKNNKDYEQIKNRVISVTPSFDCDTLIKYNEMQVRVLRLDHSRGCGDNACRIDNHLEIQNVGYVFSVGGVNLFHSGDSYPDNAKEYETLNIKQYGIDIALINRSFMLEKGVSIIENSIQPKNIIFMHLGHNQSYIYKPLAANYKNRLPYVTIPEKPMETAEFK
jgi:L-ascorbate metabolism protein UlaG (beta-lactamase superfamily)